MLYYSLDRKIEEVKNKLSKEIDSVRGELARGLPEFREAFYSYQNTLIDFLAARML
ncbi:hypothetical protein [Pyrobaculum ferrireducens]|uniref:Uncharacterized protein n=1 Tax=Pyrobaculum ferrireducens TaxID=1104324 RepID=G7VHF2_9CREN|nr:hypothetical protein [Pyrobaculum ferrireducens]AET33243.1 hypothetical protein P186_1839 [Pyrobaculum ferrireducens]